ncbi:histidine-aspartic acid phosphotransferase 1 [Haematococcus lacustris]
MQSAAIAAQLNQYVTQLQQEGVLDDQFQQLIQLQDESNPDFVAEVVQLYVEDSSAKIDKIAAMLTTVAEPDFNELDQLVHQFKGSSASLGAQTIAFLCVKLRERCQSCCRSGCVLLLSQIQQAFEVLKERLSVFIQLEAQLKSMAAMQT